MIDFFRHCPSCGRRFHVKLEEKKLVGGHRERFTGAPTLGSRAGAPIGAPIGGSLYIDIDEYQYKYKCQACGHEWSEKRIQDEPETST